MADSAYDDEEQTLINQIHEEIRKIRHSKDMIGNNDASINISDPIRRSLIENNYLKAALKDEALVGCSTERLRPPEGLLRDLKKEVEFIKKDIFKIVEKSKKFEEINARLMKNTENLELMLQASNNAQGTSKRMDVIEKNIKQRFLKEKKELKTIITTLFPDNLDLQDLIAQITEFYFTEGADKYMQMEESDKTAEQIEFLLRMEMFEVNPNNPTQIKLANLL